MSSIPESSKKIASICNKALNEELIDLISKRDDSTEFFIGNKGRGNDYSILTLEEGNVDMIDQYELFSQFEKLSLCCNDNLERIFSSIYKNCIYKIYKFNFGDDLNEDGSVQLERWSVLFRKDEVEKELSKYGLAVV